MTTRVRFWGVRGGIASPGPHTAGVGGNTSCVEVRCGDTLIVLDAGTGLRGLGDSLMGQGPVRGTLLLSHLHWDHIQGLPFFVPLYVPTTELTVVAAPAAEWTLEETLGHQMRSPVFPVRLAELPARLRFEHLRSGGTLELGDVRVRGVKLNHPGGVMAYRIEHRGRTVVYATDTEHYACVDPALRDLARGADVLIYDAQYTSDEYSGRVGRSKVGWGHSTWEAGVAVAREAGVGQLLLFHHDPQRSDEGVAELETQARRVFPGAAAAREGMVVELSDQAASEAA